MGSSSDPTFVKLVLVGDPHVGKSTLCRALSPGFAPCDGHHVYHSNNLVEMVMPDIRSPPPTTTTTTSAVEGLPIRRGIALYIIILQPRQEGDHTKLTPCLMVNTDVVGLCYTISDSRSLHIAVHKWLPFIKYHLPSTPIVLIGHQPEGLVASTSRTSGEISVGRTETVSSHLLRNAFGQIDAVHSVQWSQNSTDEDLAKPQDVAQVLAWYGYHYARNSARNATESEPGQCLLM